jgi:ABC-type Na+ transport system ATPase subunit NatA
VTQEAWAQCTNLAGLHSACKLIMHSTHGMYTVHKLCHVVPLSSGTKHFQMACTKFNLRRLRHQMGQTLTPPCEPQTRQSPNRLGMHALPVL